MKSVLVILVFLMICTQVMAQFYQTKSGLITISGRYKGQVLVAERRQLYLSINYDKAELNMHLAIPLLVTENDSLNRILAQMAGSELSFQGRLNTDHVHTTSHPKFKQQVTGTITLNKVSGPFQFQTTLEHFPSGYINCVLTGNFVLDLHSFHIPVAAGENKVHISFRELLLKKVDEQ